MSEPLKLELEGCTYIFNPHDSFTTEGEKTFYYASLKKVTPYQHKSGEKKEKFQIVTVKPAHMEAFANFIMDCLGGQPDEEDRQDDSDVPF